MSKRREHIEEKVAQEDLPDAEIRQMGADAVPILIDIFKTASDDLRDRKQRRALYALGVLGTDEAVDFLIETAENPAVDGWLRRAAVRSLGPSDHPRALDYLTSALDHPSFGVRSSAVMALSHASDARAVRGLEAAQAGDPDPRIRQRSARALEENGVDDKDHGEPPPGAKVRN